jgi:hypothetical protein
MSEEDGMAVAELEVRFAELDGYTAESAPANCCSASAFRWNSTRAR